MKLNEVMSALEEGRRIRRNINPNVYFIRRSSPYDNIVWCSVECREMGDWQPSLSDLLADDWEVMI